MTLIGRIGAIQVLGVPACALYHQTTSLDLLLPRLMAGLTISGSIWLKWRRGAFVYHATPAPSPNAPLAHNA